ncbi:MAG: 4Fe-4S dicluster domain-containing protein, partial [Chloroflexota bacterium]|nr:4Fe-4S dicluster domain-containing protein [Chloroflexota bacterium]
AKWIQWEPVNEDNVRRGAELAFGAPVHTIYGFPRADVILSLDADFLGTMPGHVQYGREFARRRRPRTEGSEMNRFYMAESTPTNTGAKADHRLRMRASEVEGFARLVASRLGIGVQTGGRSPVPEATVNALVADLRAARGRSLVIAGPNQPPAVHALAHAMNQTLGNVGSTVTYTDQVVADTGDQLTGLQQLVSDMQAGRVSVLIVIGGDPVYTAPADLPFADALRKVKLSVHLSEYGPDNSATSGRTTWHIPRSHYLEAWGDSRAIDGTVSLQQPLIEPLYESRSDLELVAALTGSPDSTAHDLVRDYWKTQLPGNLDFEVYWRRLAHDGVVPNTALPVRPVRLNANLASQLGAPRTAPSSGLEIIFQPDPSIYDGRWVNNGWLQELPKPMTKLVWDNAALMSPNTASELGVENEDVVELRYQGRTVRAPVWIAFGHPDNAVSVWLGYGQPNIGAVAEGAGFNAYALRTSRAPWFDSGLSVRKLEEKYTLVSTQDHFSIEGRDHARHATAEEYQRNPNVIQEQAEGHIGVSMYPEYKYAGNAWGMAVDMSTCIGCNACVVACQAENNIPVVGKAQVNNGREMHWLRIDTYFTGTDLSNPEVILQPMFCQHCEKAPCEYVCPVAATVHSSEGLNDMVYNRCVGTRYCSNNCPYKVRRFNWLQYNDKKTEILKLQRNPDVTVRERGVMEKCTYCTQRIAEARILASKENRAIRDGEILTACQAACPADALVFGNINDSTSHVVALKKQARNYSVLGQLNTAPRTTYLATLRNPNPTLQTQTRGE